MVHNKFIRLIVEYISIINLFEDINAANIFLNLVKYNKVWPVKNPKRHLF